MFWEQQQEKNSLDTLLETDNYTLEQVLLDENVFDNIFRGDPKLMEFLNSKENLLKLLDYCLKYEAENGQPVNEQYRLNFMASKVFTIYRTQQLRGALFQFEETKQYLTEYINDKTPMAQYASISFARIMEKLMREYFDSLFDIIKSSSYFDKCLDNVDFGALGEITIIGKSWSKGDEVVNWLAEEKVIDRIVDRMNDHSSDETNEYLSDTLCKFVESQSIALASDSKNILSSEYIVNDELISRIADKLVVTDPTDFSEVTKNVSAIKNAAKILDCYLNCCFSRRSPARLIEQETNKLEKIRRNMDTKMDDNEKEDEMNDFPILDPERIVEGIVINRLNNMLQTLLTDIENGGNVWNSLMQLLCSLCNLNNLKTHENLLKCFEALPLTRLIEVARKQPKMSILHNMIHKMISQLLYTKFHDHQQTVSPIVMYLLKNGNLIETIYKYSSEDNNHLPMIERCCLRAFNMNIANAILNASLNSPLTYQYTMLLNENPKWNELYPIIEDYNRKYQPACMAMSMNESEFISDMETNENMFSDDELNEQSCNNVFDHERALNKGSFDFSKLARELDLAHFDDTPDEDEFKKLCSERANSSPTFCNKSLDELDTSQGSNTDTVCWPGAGTAEKNSEVAEANTDDNDWFTNKNSQKSTGSENSSNDNSEGKNGSSWADFSSADSPKVAFEVSWPGAEKNEKDNSEWPSSGADVMTSINFTSDFAKELQDSSEA